MYRYIIRQGCRKSLHKSTKRYITTAGLKEGVLIHNYKVSRVTAVPELFLSAIELKHLGTNSNHLHIARDDNNYVFNVCLRTTPMDSTGVAHILEHIALCGSSKYPVRDPFFKMLDRSMATFMNAMTGSDYTMYPFATQNGKDFKNLMSIYLDAVFFPLLHESSFLQEGWRLGHSVTNDVTSPIIFKGVVFNEMKGVMTDQEYLFGSNMQRNILPDHTYGNFSGGDPSAIPQLTWQDLKDFHRTHYHPSNANFYTYGNLDIIDCLKQIDEQVMQKFTSMQPNTDVPSQVRWSTPRAAEISCSPDDMAANPEKQSSVAVSFLLSDVKDSYTNFVLSVLCSLLSDGPSSPFYKALIESGIGSDYAPSSGFHSHQKESVFSIGLQGICSDDQEKVKNIVYDTLDSVVKNGFPTERVEGVLHQVELHQKHQSSQFGLHLSFNLMPVWQHGSDPVKSLDFDSHIANLRKNLDADPNLFQKYCKKYFVDNNHKLILAMVPDPEYKDKQTKQESTLLNSKLDCLSQNDKSKIYKQGQELEELQNEVEDISCLPTLLVSDISRKQKETEIPDILNFDSSSKVVMHGQPTNGITYFSLLKTVNNIPDELRPLLPLFCSVLTQMGTKDTDYQRFADLEQLYTGGLDASIKVSPSPTNHLSMESKVAFGSYCLDKNIDHMFSLWSELLSKPNFEDRDRLQILIRQRAQELANSVSFSGHRYAMLNASSNLSPAATQDEMFGGLQQVRLMRSVAEEQNIDKIFTQLQEVSKYVLTTNVNTDEKVRCSIHSTGNMRQNVESQLSNFLCQISQTNSKIGEASTHTLDILHPVISPNFIPTPAKQLLQEMPFPVNFSSMCLPTPAVYTHRDSATLRILSRILSTKYLLREVREKGGAYGAGARHCNDGVFQFYSYRDPRSIQTIESFCNSIEWACEGGFSREDIDEAILAIFQQVDAPVSPCNIGNAYFINGISDEMRQKYREQLLDVNRQAIIDAAQKYLTLDNKSSVILGPKNEEIEHENQKTAMV
uniref:presequence protease, mitochondrial-like n=1 Tax=Styela clava TaxID=7725 RepID=UPI00193A2994|nr:presequence protease, mitochondrial-like [Styela clava]